jgi:hypothetical protein
MLNNIAALLDAGVAASTNSYESIATTTVGSGGTSTITFTSIPSTYKHLQIRAIARDANGSNDFSTPQMVINSDTSSTYARHYLSGNGTTASAGSTPTTGFAYVGAILNNGTTANSFAIMIVDLLDYQNTNKYKTIRNLSGGDTNSIGNVALTSALWQSTSAITSISFTSSSTANFVQYSSFALYGIKG